MGKSNNLYHKFKTVYQKKNNLNNFLKEDKIQLLENISHFFIDQVIIELSNFIKNNIKLLSYSMKIESYNSNEKNIENVMFFNLVENKSYNNRSIIIFSSDFLSVIIDFLFGGNIHFTDQIHKIVDITSTELSINQKIIRLIISSLSNFYKNFFSKEINFVHTKTVFDIKKIDVDLNQNFLINNFYLKINKKEVSFSILTPLLEIKKINNKTSISLANKNKSDIEKNTLNSLCLDDISNLELNIIVKIINISISYDTLKKLSIGDVLSIKKPDIATVFIENKPAFLGYYKRFNKQSVVFIKEFIDNNLEKNKEYSDE